MTDFIERLLTECQNELSFFESGKLKENDLAVYERVGDYWRSIGIEDIDGRTSLKDSQGKTYNPAWSSAFISFVTRNAGAKDNFKYSSAHCHYVEFSRQAARNNLKSAYYAVSPYSAVPAPGDIIVSGREYAAQYTFEQADLAYIADGFYPSHGDVVIDVNRDSGVIFTIGGNVSNSVSQKKLLISDDGVLLDRPDGANFLPWLALLQCRL